MSTPDGSREDSLPLRLGDALSQERKASIERALRKYRDRVLELNMHTLNIVIQDYEKLEDVPDEMFETEAPESPPDQLEARRLELLEFSFGIGLDPLDPSVTTIRDLLAQKRRENLIRTCRLDGVKQISSEVDLNVRNAWIERRNAWIEKTENKLSAATEAKAHPRSLPADLKYLMTLVRALCGSGLPGWRFFGEFNQLKFLSDVDGDPEESESATDSGRVVVPPTEEEEANGKFGLIRHVWGNYEVALVVLVGPHGFAVYCRPWKDSRESRRDESPRDDVSDGGWGWKYGLSNAENDSKLYPTIEDFLDFYAERHKQTSENSDISG